MPPNYARHREMWSRLLRIEMFFDAHPALVIIWLQRRRAQCKPGRLEHLARLEHECHSVDHLVRLAGVALARFFKGGRVWTMAAHAIVQTGTARPETGSLGVVGTMNQPHEFTGHITMEPRWPKRMFGGQPAWRKDHEIQRIHTRRIALCLQH